LISATWDVGMHKGTKQMLLGNSISFSWTNQVHQIVKEGEDFGGIKNGICLFSLLACFSFLFFFSFYIASDNQVFPKKNTFLCVRTREKFIVFEKLDCNLQYRTFSFLSL
jgi:hypothetical protein